MTTDETMPEVIWATPDKVWSVIDFSYIDQCRYSLDPDGTLKAKAAAHDAALEDIRMLRECISKFMSSASVQYFDSYYTKGQEAMDEYWQIHAKATETLAATAHWEESKE